ncbi:hypothetical protein [Legionella erythra]|uniref:Uncharacterized protein n=1 Tax=Legionella erythra TaxID=448 RepID=A0A0W0TPU1_LEGER|nr:hypothetical protein [Legionella erythra]KTC97596.1 hypothetical protein Lery_1435 [Legionella erythra]
MLHSYYYKDPTGGVYRVRYTPMHKLHDVSELVDGNWRDCPILSQTEDKDIIEAILAPTLAIPEKNGQIKFLLPKQSFDLASIELGVRRGFLTDKLLIKLTPAENPIPEKTEEVRIRFNHHRAATQVRPLSQRVLSAEQRQKLEHHRAKLEKRQFEYRFFSYVVGCLPLGDCFGKGYKKSEKIREINHLLNGEAVDEDVLQQGRTGRILRG